MLEFQRVNENEYSLHELPYHFDLFYCMESDTWELQTQKRFENAGEVCWVLIRIHTFSDSRFVGDDISNHMLTTYGLEVQPIHYNEAYS